MGLRCVQIEGGSFGMDDGWYKAFLEAERIGGYPLKAFSDTLAPLHPTAHLQLLTATLEIFSSLAAHAEINSTSQNKLCKDCGCYRLIASRIKMIGEPSMQDGNVQVECSNTCSCLKLGRSLTWFTILSSDLRLLKQRRIH